MLHDTSPLISDLFWLYFNDCYLKDDCLQYIFKPKQLMMCMNSLILPANDCSSIYLSIVGIAIVCMIVFGFIFHFIIPAKAFARDYVITGVRLSVCLFACLSVCYHDN